jgi:glycosyltransferase involved in cell wall biosynthesis
MKKICILQNSMVYGGTDTFVINLSKKLVMDGYDVTVILSTDSKRKESREDELSATGVTIIKTCSLQMGIFLKFKHFFLLYKELKKGKFDVFQTNIDLFNGPQLFIAWLVGIPIRECHSHNSEQGRELREGRTWKVRIYQRVMRWMCWTFSNRRGGCSELAMNFLFEKKWKNDSNSRVIHNGIDLSAFTLPLNIGQKAQELGLTNRHNICTVGRIAYQKNPVFIVEIMNAIFQMRDDCDFVWIGTGDMEDSVRNRISEYRIENRVHLLGNRTDVSEILRCSDLFLLPSLFEGLGIVLIEAQAAGLPCVVSDTTPLEANCGGCLSLSIKETPQYWAQQISDVLDGKIHLKVDYHKLNKFSIDYMVKEMEELFDNE